MFQFIIFSINNFPNHKQSPIFIEMVDLAGFGNFCSFICFFIDLISVLFSEHLLGAPNSYEQFCINYVNEKFQHFFAERMIKEEEQWYDIENIDVPKVAYLNNSAIIGILLLYTRL